MSDPTQVKACPGHPTAGDLNVCTHEHLPGILYTHEDTDQEPGVYDQMITRPTTGPDPLVQEPSE